MMEGKALVEDSDMPMKMQIQAMAFASQLLDDYDVFDCKSIAAHIKKEFDQRYGNGWQCVVGSNFVCFFTHTKGTFIYFTLETLNFSNGDSGLLLGERNKDEEMSAGEEVAIAATVGITRIRAL